jgi:hypothetical protein
LPQLPASHEIVSVFASDQATAGLNPSSINRRAAAIGYHHRAGGYPAPTTDRRPPTAGRLAEVLAGIRAKHGSAKRHKRPADAAAVRHMLTAIEGEGLRALRDRAILAIGKAAASRANHCPFEDRQGIVIAIPEGWRIRPKMLLLVWMAAAGHVEGPPFRRLLRLDAPTPAAMSDRAIARLAQHHAAAAGYYPKQFAGQSLCAGFLPRVHHNARRSSNFWKLADINQCRFLQTMYGIRIFSRIMRVRGLSKRLTINDIKDLQVDVSTCRLVGIDMPVRWPRDHLSQIEPWQTF